jgi:broad specificity phosphatase PhoE
MTTFLLIRHGMTDAVGSFFAGRAPGLSLNAQGRTEAERVAERLRDVPLAAVISSPLDRTRETATAIAAPHRLDVVVNDAFNEFDVGPWTGTRFSDLTSSPEWARFNAARSVTRAPGGELMIDVQHRAAVALLELARQYDGAIVAVVSHGDVIRALLQYFLGMPIDFLHRLDIAPARISIVEVSETGVRVRQVNGDSATLLA